MKSNRTRSVKPTQACIDEEPLSYAQFALRLAQYKRAVYESIQQAANPIQRLLEQ
ncbi:hypothetical protein [Spirosoma pulveris]